MKKGLKEQNHVSIKTQFYPDLSKLIDICQYSTDHVRDDLIL